MKDQEGLKKAYMGKYKTYIYDPKVEVEAEKLTGRDLEETMKDVKKRQQDSTNGHQQI